MISQGLREQVRRARPTITRPTEVSEGPNSTAKETTAREVSYGPLRMGRARGTHGQSPQTLGEPGKRALTSI